MATYLLSVFGPTQRTPWGNYSSKEEMLQSFSDTGAFNDKLQRDGHFVHAGGLREGATATTVDGRGDQPSVTAGPYLESVEQLGGFWVIEAANDDEAVALAAEASRACRGKVEVRAFHTDSDIQALLQG